MSSSGAWQGRRAAAGLLRPHLKPVRRLPAPTCGRAGRRPAGGGGGGYLPHEGSASGVAADCATGTPGAVKAVDDAGLHCAPDIAVPYRQEARAIPGEEL